MPLLRRCQIMKYHISNKEETNDMRTKNNKVRVHMSDRMFNSVLMVILTILFIITLYPMIYVVSSSFSSGNAVSSGSVILWPVELSLTGYKLVFNNSDIWKGYANTILYAVAGTTVHLFMTICLAYPLSRKGYSAKPFVTTFMMISMFLSGGLIPTYLLISNLGLVNTRTWMIISGAVSISHAIIMRTFIQSNIPNELYESASMDGITQIGFLTKIVLPLSKASISVITLYGLVGKWNAYTGPMIYLQDEKKWPLQLVARDILSAAKVNMEAFDSSAFVDASTLAGTITSERDVMRYALIVVSVLPMMLIYPFMQKFFAKGVMIGSVKG